jgi:lambda repressor-like predicted transcriptional regulator
MDLEFRLDESDVARFRAMIDRDGPIVRDELGPCWVWIGATSQFGHGQFVVKSTKGGTHPRYAGHGAHRIAWIIDHPGQVIPKGLMVRHRCDNPPCVRPLHLELGTAGDNMRDMYERGRAMVGERHGQSKLCDEDVRNMRAEYASEGTAMCELARRFGVTDMTIRDVLLGRSWRHVTGGTPVQRAQEVSARERARRRAAHATKRKHEGAAHHLTPFQAEDIIAIRQAYIDGATAAELSRESGVSRTAIGQILAGRVWKSVTQGVDVRRTSNVREGRS